MGLKTFARTIGAWSALYSSVRGLAVAVTEGVPPKGAVEPIDPTTAFEPSDIHAGPVMLTGICLLAGIASITALLYFVFAYFTHREAVLSPPPLPTNIHGSRMPLEPQLQAEPVMEMRDMRVYEDETLNNYRWVDRKSGTVSIPIERAMQLVAGQGISPESGAGFTYYDPQAGSRRTGLEGKVEPEPR